MSHKPLDTLVSLSKERSEFRERCLQVFSTNVVLKAIELDNFI